MKDMFDKYKESAKNCKCKDWCRADYASGFYSIHHGGCGKFDPIKEIHILSRDWIKSTQKVIDSQKENKNLKELLNVDLNEMATLEGRVEWYNRVKEVLK